MFDFFKKEPRPERTIVDVRGLQTPAKYWTAEVHYDAWGTPYIIGGYYHSFTKHVLEKNGSVRETGTVQWKWKSGPDVTFGNKHEASKGWRPSDV